MIEKEDQLIQTYLDKNIELSNSYIKLNDYMNQSKEFKELFNNQNEIKIIDLFNRYKEYSNKHISFK